MASRIPDDLLEDIGKRLDTETDVCRFRAVCKSWRSLIPPFKKRMQFPIRVRRWNIDELPLSESVVYHLAPPPAADDPHCERGWLIKVRGGLIPGKTLMMDPLSQLGVRVNQFPESFPKVLNLLDYRVFEVSRTYHVLYNKVVMPLDLDDFPVFLMISFTGTLYYGKCGFEDEEIIEVSELTGGCYDRYFEDAIFYKGKFYAMSLQGEVVVVDSCLNGTLLDPKLGWSKKTVSRKLVESNGDLLLVKKKTNNLSADKKHTEFRVYKLSADNKKWRKIREEALRDRILILGDDFSYSLCKLDFPPGYEWNDIFFSTLVQGFGRWKLRNDFEAMLAHIGVFDLKNGRYGTLRSCSSFDNIFYPTETHLWRVSMMESRLPKFAKLLFCILLLYIWCISVYVSINL